MKSAAVSMRTDRTNELDRDKESRVAVLLRRVDNLDRHMARIVNRLQAIEKNLGMSVLNDDSTTVMRKAHKTVATKSVMEAIADGEVEYEEEEVEAPSIKLRKKHDYSVEERHAIGVRLQTARAGKLGLTYDEFKAMRLRPDLQD